MSAAKCPRCKGSGHQGKKPDPPTSSCYRLPKCSACAGAGTLEAFDEYRLRVTSRAGVGS